jgi:hypothetical protein
MIALNNWVKFMFTISLWPYVYRWQVVENKILLSNLPPQNLSKVAKKLNIMIKHNAYWNIV